MRRTTAGPATEANALCRWVIPVLDRLPAALGLDVPFCRSADLTSTKALMSSLKTAVESRLGTNFCFAALSVDDPSSHQSRLAEQALEQIGLRQIMVVGRRAKNVIRVFGPDSAPAYDEEPWLVLAVDYDTHWYNIGLYEIGEGGIVSPIEDFVHGPRFDEENRLEAATDELQNILSKMGHVKHIFLYGNQRENRELLDLLAHTLGSELVNNARVDGSVWTSTSYMAEAAHVRMDDIQFEMDPASNGAFGCKWRSKLYRDGHEEL
ncbi:hypothetical protein BDW02DRAFT_246732 [Decorospora gaudefroyi]|uniref:Uncharacterized protein n=1 Tax=Decorospora gaudefroyi TaxID=184978 RepID=A0A6A5K1E7_9PLEO|nr:hypothetical protein BDW02DRAFT_246732 [Decorospora gaudefroyi]